MPRAENAIGHRRAAPQAADLRRRFPGIMKPARPVTLVLLQPIMGLSHRNFGTNRCCTWNVDLVPVPMCSFLASNPGILPQNSIAVAGSAEDMTDPVLDRLRRDVRRVYEDRVASIVLFGSRARGEAGIESDYDVAVFLRDYTGGLDEVDRLADLSWDIQKETGAVVSPLPFPAEEFHKDSTLMASIRRDGVQL